MQQIYEVKVIALTRGGLAGGKKNSVVTMNCKKSAEVIVPKKKKKFFREGPNNHKFRVRS